MNYRIRPGIVRISICGVQLLIPTREASESCPRIMRLNLLYGIIWDMLEKEITEETAFRSFQILLKKPDDIINARMKKILDSYIEKGYLIAEIDKSV